jgi:hypothetical protein
MTKYVWHDGSWVRAVRVSRPSVFPGIIRDSMDAVLHPADGKHYDSKSQFRRVTAEHGLIELGNDAPIGRPDYQPEGVKDDIIQSIKMLEEGYVPPPVETVDSLEGAPVETRFLE